ncbi:MAG: hypothetical protein KY468_19635, partial [Armatimonadetes bacterium]|nr:hypothetical protein [Armatimonadota bacterium]
MPPPRSHPHRRRPTPPDSPPVPCPPRRGNGQNSAALPVLLLLGSLSLSGPTLAQSPAPAPAPSASPSAAPSTERVKFEILTADGGALYRLTHGGINPNSLSVRAGGQPLRLGQDCFLNPVSGLLTLAQPLESGASLTVRYRYNPQSDGAGQAMGFAFTPGGTGGTKLNFVYAATPGGLNFGAGSGSQVTGVLIDPQKVGTGKFSGMSMVSRKGANPFSALRRPREGRIALLTHLIGNEKKEDSGSGDLHQYAMDDVKVGSATFGLTYRKVGKN